VPGQQLDGALVEELLDRRDLDLRHVPAGAVDLLAAEASRHAVDRAALDGEGDAGDVAPQCRDHLGRRAGVDQVRAHHPLGVQVVHQGAVGADGQPAVAGLGHHRRHPPGRAAGDQDQHRTGLLDPGQRGTGAVRDGPVCAHERAVEVGGDEAGRHGLHRRARPRVRRPGESGPEQGQRLKSRPAWPERTSTS
jgi:hypothetical protein